MIGFVMLFLVPCAAGWLFVQGHRAPAAALAVAVVVHFSLAIGNFGFNEYGVIAHARDPSSLVYAPHPFAVTTFFVVQALGRAGEIGLFVAAALGWREDAAD